MCQRLNCCSLARFGSETPSPAQVCRQTREVRQPWGTCHAHTLLPPVLRWWPLHSPRLFPSQRMGTRPASLPCFAAFIGTELFLPSSSLPLLLFFLFFSTHVSVVLPATMEQVSRRCHRYLTAGNIDGGGSGFAVVVSRWMEVNQWAGCMLLGLGGCKSTELGPLCHLNVSGCPLCKGSSCHMQPCGTSRVFSTSFSVLQNGRTCLCSSP